MTDVFVFPEISPDTFRLTPDVGAGQSISESEFSGAQSVISFWGSERWRLEMAYSELTNDDRADMMAFITKLRVSRNVFLARNFSANNRGALSGSPVVAISSLGGSTLVVGGIGGTVSSWGRAGDFIAVNSQLKMILNDVGAASGVASLDVWPPLFNIPSSGTAVVVTSAMGGFRLLKAVSFDTDPPGYRTSLSISAIERVNSSMVSDIL